MAPASEALARLAESPVGARARELWSSRRVGPVLKTVVAFSALITVLRVLLRNNQPPGGTLVYGAMLGLLYALLAFGLILVYRANRIINFAQAELGAAPAVLAVLLIKVDHVPYLVALVIAVVTAVVLGVIIDRVIVRRFHRAPRLILSVATIGVALMLGAIQFYLPKWIGGSFLINQTPPRTPFTHFHLKFQGVIFTGDTLIVILATALVVVALTLFFRLTDIGIGVRASAENADRATLLGINVKGLSTVVWAIAAALSSLGVFLRVPLIGLPIGADVGPQVLLYALTAAVIAGMESFPVALGAGVALGVMGQAVYYFSRDPSLSDALLLPILLVAMLLQRRTVGRGEDTGLATWKQATEFRPLPPELRAVPTVQWVRVGLAALALAGLAGLPYLVGVEQQILASVVLMYGMVAVSLVILTGWAGQISLGQWGFAGVGALVAGGLAAHMRSDFFVNLIVAGLTGAVVAVIIGLPALRIRGLYLAVTTLAFAIAVQVYLISPNYTKRFLPNNTQAIERPLLYGRYSIAGPRAFYFVTLGALGLCVASARALRNSRAGRVIVAARDNERGAQSYGVNLAKARLAAFAISGFWAALAGGLFAYHQKVVETQAFDISISLLLLIIVVIGGVTSLPGAILGTLWIGALRYGNFNPSIQLLASGFGVLLLLWVFPGGLAQVFYGIRDAGLRWVADRQGIVVPSLVADTMTTSQDEPDVLEGAPVHDAFAPLATGSVGAIRTAGNTNGHGAAVVCPVCQAAVPLDEVTDHEHFAVVDT
jgi:branched-chain amino acid transport system permease protein